MSPSFSGMEKQVIKWLCETVGYTNTLESSGILLSGGSMANFMSVLCAREIKLKDPNNYHKGLVYCSDQTHHSFLRGCYIGGIPKKNIRVFPTSIQSNFEINFQELESRIEKDLKENEGIPFLLVCNLGATNTGKIENIEEFIRISKKYDLWVHADGCYGACFTLLQKFKVENFKGIENFDSISIDPHKGFFCAFGIGGFLIKHWKSLMKTFSLKTEEIPYYPNSSEDNDDFLNSKLLTDTFEMGIENSRDFKALKLWLPLYLVGTNTFKTYLEEKIYLSSFLTDELKKIENLQVISNNLTITLFRYFDLKNDRSVEKINSINKEFLTKINSYGDVVISQTLLRDENSSALLYVCRACVLCVRTHKEEIIELIKNIRKVVDFIKIKYSNNSRV